MVATQFLQQLLLLAAAVLEVVNKTKVENTAQTAVLVADVLMDVLVEIP
jgi:hypothetical protein